MLAYAVCELVCLTLEYDVLDFKSTGGPQARLDRVEYQMATSNFSRSGSHIRRTERVYLKLLLGLVGAAVLLVGLIWGGHRAFRRWQEHRLVQQAEEFFERGRDPLAVKAAFRAFEINPRDVAACRLLARIAEKTSSVSAVDWRRRVYELQPESIPDAVAFANAALRFKDKARAATVLEAIAQRGVASADYHAAAAQLAILNKDVTSAQAHLAEAIRLEPQSKIHALNLAVLQLQSPEDVIREAARTALRDLMPDERLRLPATRALLEDALQRRDVSAVVSLSDNLRNYPEAALRDHLISLTLLRQSDQQAFAGQLTRTEAFAAPDPAKVADLISWMSENQMALLALDWTKRLPPELLTKDRIPLAIADCHAALGAWTDLQLWCRKETWPAYDYLRHAYMARAARELGSQFEDENEWNVTLKEAGSNPAFLSNLARVVSKWNWRQEAEALLWRLAGEQQNKVAALSALAQYYAEIGDTPNLYRVALRSSEADPEDTKAANNVAQLSLLLGFDPERGRALAKRLYESDPLSAVAASTYAFGLYTQQHYKQALKVMEALPPDQLREPSIAAYYGIILTAAGETDKAKEFLSLAETAKLLPEEKALVSLARTNIAR